MREANCRDKILYLVVVVLCGSVLYDGVWQGVVRMAARTEVWWDVVYGKA